MKDMCEELMEIDNVENGMLVTKNNEETQFLSLVSDDEEENNERIEFDTTRVTKSTK